MCHDVSPQALTRPRDRVNLTSALSGLMSWATMSADTMAGHAVGTRAAWVSSTRGGRRGRPLPPVPCTGFVGLDARRGPAAGPWRRARPVGGRPAGPCRAASRGVRCAEGDTEGLGFALNWPKLALAVGRKRVARESLSTRPVRSASAWVRAEGGRRRHAEYPLVETPSTRAIVATRKRAGFALMNR